MEIFIAFCVIVWCGFNIYIRYCERQIEEAQKNRAHGTPYRSYPPRYIEPSPSCSSYTDTPSKRNKSGKTTREKRLKK